MTPAYNSAAPFKSHRSPVSKTMQDDNTREDTGVTKPSEDNGVAKPGECIHVQVGVVFYNILLKPQKP